MNKQNAEYYLHINSLLELVNKPARYTGNEIFSIYKKDMVTYRVAFSYPDLYEIGMSNLTVRLFYFIANKIPDTAFERVFMPAKDLYSLLKSTSTKLFTLESWTPCKNMDIFAFTIQTELVYTNILAMLKIAQISIKNSNRAEDEPIILAGGISVINPEPLAPFIDLFFIGDGEELITALILEDKKNKENGFTRKERIEKLTNLDGIFSYPINKKIKPVLLPDLNAFSYPAESILPLVKPIQDRPVIEIAKGCLNNCRFCQAGYFYRPYRERDALSIVEIASDIIHKTGCEELNITSLSIADFTNITDVIKALEYLCAKYKVSLSVPSLRIMSFDIAILSSLSSVRKTGLTFAVEAGCKLHRNKINKKFDESKFFSILEEAIKLGWKSLKLYFIVGFPEIDDEEEAISNFLLQCSNCFPKLDITVSIALLIPKVLTAFEDYDQMDINTFIEIVNNIKKNVKRQRITVKYHNPFVSRLEYYLSNSDESASVLLQDAYDNDIAYDGWTEHFNKEFYASRNIFDKKPDKKSKCSDFHISVRNKFLAQEKKHYKNGIMTESCLETSCFACGCCDESANKLSPKYSYEELIKNVDKSKIKWLCEDYIVQKNAVIHYKLRFDKMSLYKYVGHLDFYVMMIRLLRLYGFAFEYSSGFNPNAKIIFPFPAPHGVESYDDIFYFSSYSDITDISQCLKAMRSILPDGLYIHDLEVINDITKYRKSQVFYLYLEIPLDLNFNMSHNEIEKLLTNNNIEPAEIAKNNQILRCTALLKENQKSIFKILGLKQSGWRKIICEPS